MADLLRVLRLSAARIGELLALDADRIDRTDPCCWVYTPGHHKGTHKAKTRTIYFGPRAVALLDPYFAASGGGRLFRYARNTVSHAVRKACVTHGIPRWHPHQLRHAAATEIRSRFGLEAAQVVLGHCEIGVTQVYAEADTVKAREAMKGVG